MNTKKIPALIMLLAGSVACIVTFLNHYSLIDMLVTLLWVMLIFLVIGLIIKMILDSFKLPSDESLDDNDGEVVEKQLSEEGEDIGEDVGDGDSFEANDDEGMTP